MSVRIRVTVPLGFANVFGSQRCDCGPQLREAVEQISQTGGYLLYPRQEGYRKLDAYAANRALGHADDERDYTAAVQMLDALGVGSVDLLTNNPDKPAALRACGIEVREVLPTGVYASAANVRYLRAKVEHSRHTMTFQV